MVNHCEVCDSYKKCDMRPSALLPAVYIKQVHSIFLIVGLKPESEMMSLELPGHAGAICQLRIPQKSFRKKKSKQKKNQNKKPHIKKRQKKKKNISRSV